ncbi:Hsp20/alpha crystallin family protein [Spirochaeta cellobiosiphila]|uniref:Hsp20/alpha crystallin family protein n=1 Tax=Spirochaeta cellobiosiphila TaxID=504483 RepID=UPI0003F957D4|nr:Hsp20/alpha crystallin family protein [Spirochaeta cellobiosiphila]
MRYLVSSNNGLDWSRDVERMMNGLWGNNLSTAKPAVDFIEKDSEYLLVADLPGIDQKDVKLEVKDNLLTFSNIEKEDKTEEKLSYLLRERRSNTLSRSFRLPKDSDQDNIKAELKNGILTINIAKKPEASPKRIAID